MPFCAFSRRCAPFYVVPEQCECVVAHSDPFLASLAFATYPICERQVSGSTYQENMPACFRAFLGCSGALDTSGPVRKRCGLRAMVSRRCQCRACDGLAQRMASFSSCTQRYRTLCDAVPRGCSNSRCSKGRARNQNHHATHHHEACDISRYTHKMPLCYELRF